MTETPLKSKLGQNARHFRFVSRSEMFKQKRKTYDELDYLKFYENSIRNSILYSMQAPIPQPLPPLTLQTISLYRRQSQPVFKTRNLENQGLQGHMTYQSLWILASIEEKLFDDFPGVVRQFERDLALYLSANSNDIRQMAVIAAGNKIIGKQPQIMSIVQKDPHQLWVLANHIYENKISYKRLFQFMASMDEIAFKTLFELTLIIQKEISESIMTNEAVLQSIFLGLDAESQPIRKYSMRIIGNIIVDNHEHIFTLCKYNILDHLFKNLNCSNCDVRRDACWVISNLCFKKPSATLVIRHTMIISKLVQLLASEAVLIIKKQLTYIFAYIAHFADKIEALRLLGHENVLQICYAQLNEEDVDLNIITLRLIKQLVELGDNFKNQDDGNLFLNLIRQMNELSNEISKKSYSQNNEVSSICLEIMNYLQEDQQ